jgi:hypothetical protein
MNPPTIVESWRVAPVLSRRNGRRWGACLFIGTVQSSPIAAVDGNIVTTRSGSRYELAGDLAELTAHPFYLDGGEAFPPGAVVPNPPPAQGAGLAELTAHYGDRAFVGIHPDGDYETYAVDSPATAWQFSQARGFVLYLNGVRITEAP